MATYFYGFGPRQLWTLQSWRDRFKTADEVGRPERERRITQRR
jgi:hypothetical protein